MKTINVLILLIDIVYVLVSTGTVYKVNVDTSLNIRKSASTSSKIKGSLTNNQFIYATSVSDGWAHFYKGYVSVNYLSEATSGFNYITTKRVNFRTGPSTDYNTTTTKNKGTEVIYFDKDPFNSNWSITNYGYVYSEYIKLNDSKKEYDFAVGLIEMEVVQEILDGRKEKWWNVVMDYIENNNDLLLFFDKDDRRLFVNTVWDELRTNNKFKALINYMNFKHAGFYLGTNGEGKLFDFDLNGIHNKSYIFDESYLKKDDNDKIGWNWYKLNIYGKTYVSPDNLYKTLKEYESKNNFFTVGSYHPWCNNCQDFVKWCLENISNNENEVRLVPGHTIDIVKDNYMYLTTPDHYKWAIETINDILSICIVEFRKIKFIKTNSLIKDAYLIWLFNKVLNIAFFPVGEFGQGCSVMDIEKLLGSDYNKTCKYYDYSGLINFKLKFTDVINNLTFDYDDLDYKVIKGTNIAANDDFNFDFVSDNNLCFEFDSGNNTASDNEEFITSTYENEFSTSTEFTTTKTKTTKKTKTKTTTTKKTKSTSKKTTTTKKTPTTIQEDNNNDNYNNNKSDNNYVSDNDLNTSGTPNIKYFSFQYTISVFILMFTFWIFILH